MPRWIEWIAVAVLSVVFLYGGLLGGWRTLNTDFPNYYIVARLYRDGQSTNRIYEWEWLQRQYDRIGGTSLIAYVPHPPLAFVPLLPLARFPALTAKRIWLLCNLGLLLATICLLSSLVSMRWRSTTLLVLLAVVPLRNNFLFGQYYVLLLFLIVVALWLYQRHFAMLSTLSLVIGAALKLYPVLFVLYFLRKRQWRLFTFFMVATAAGLAAAVMMIGAFPVLTFVREVLSRAPRGEIVNGFDLRNGSFTALLNRLFLFQAQLNPHPVTHAPIFYSWFQPLCNALVLTFAFFTMSKRSSAEDDTLDWAVLTTTLLGVSSIPMTYHYCLLIAPAVIGIGYFLRHGRSLAATAILAGYLLVGLPIPTPSSDNPWLAVFRMPRLIGVMVIFATFAIERMERLHARRALAVAAMVGVIAVPGIVGNLRHFRHTDLWERVVLPERFVSMRPSIAGERILFVTIAERYVVRADAGTDLTAAAGDAFHPTAARNGEAWAEISGERSQIWKLAGPSNPAQYVADGESPSVSPDARRLAFVRDDAGTPKLWLRRVSDGLEAEVELPKWEVMDSSLSDHQLVFSAMRGGETALFRLALDTHETPVLLMRGAVRDPAIAADDSLLAFSRREGGSWHLWVRDLKSGHETRLTVADCNAITPAWSLNGANLYYASDCGRGLGLPAIHVIPRAEIDRLLAAR